MSIRATGMNWLAKFPTVRPYVRIGTQYVPIESITPDPQDSGVSTLTVKLPFDISGDSVPIVIEVVQTDGRSDSEQSGCDTGRNPPAGRVPGAYWAMTRAVRLVAPDVTEGRN